MERFEKVIAALVKVIGSVEWERLREILTGRRYALTIEDHHKIHEILKTGPHVLLTWRRAHMSSYFVVAGHFLLTGRIVRWSHVALSVIDNGKVKAVEAIGKGVVLSEFEEVFNCDGAMLLKPRISEGFDWPSSVYEARENIGKKYDNLCNLGDPKEMNCVEVILDALKRDPDYRSRFHGLDAMIKNEHNLTPPMFLESGSFDVVLEVRR